MLLGWLHKGMSEFTKNNEYKYVKFFHTWEVHFIGARGVVERERLLVAARDQGGLVARTPVKAIHVVAENVVAAVTRRLVDKAWKDVDIHNKCMQ